MKLIGLISGGKDSVFNLLHCIAAGHEIIAIGNIEPYKNGDETSVTCLAQITGNAPYKQPLSKQLIFSKLTAFELSAEELDSFMYQSVGHEAVSLIAGALNLPIFRMKTKGTAICKSKSYVGTPEDEVEDLLHLLSKVKKDINIEGVSVGAIASDYQRTRVENVCARLGLRCFAYMWRRNQEELLQEMIDAEMDAILIKVASIGLHPDIHLGMSIKDIKPYLIDLHRKFGVNICGEGGEYETLTLDCPLFHRTISIIDSEKVVLSNDAFAPVGYLNVKKATLKSKSWDSDDPVKSLATRLAHIKSIIKDPSGYIMDCLDDVTANIFPQNPTKSMLNEIPFPFESELESKEEKTESLTEYWKKSVNSSLSNSLKGSSSLRVPNSSSSSFIDSTNCNLNYSSGWCSIGNVAGSNITEAIQCLQKHLERVKYEFSDVVFVNLYIRDMSSFVSINKIYGQQMPESLPPARACVGTPLPPDVGVVIVLVAHKVVSKSQKVFHSSFIMEREAMHVQSISHWAPANIGPYSQCIKIGIMYYLAGQIPLIPGSMEILNKPIFHQCKLTLRHVLRVLQAMNENFTFCNVFQAICYVTTEEIAYDIQSLWSYITKTNTASVAVVVVNELPKNAQLEWEVIGCGLNNPHVEEEVQVVDDYNLFLKRCVHSVPFASTAVCKVSHIKRPSKPNEKSPRKSLKLVTREGLNSVIKKCVLYLRTESKNPGTPLCMMKLFYKASDLLLANTLNEVTKYSVEYKVVCTAIPVVACEDSETFLTITGICH